MSCELVLGVLGLDFSLIRLKTSCASLWSAKFNPI